MKTQLNETGNIRTGLILFFYYGNCDEKGRFFDSLRFGVFSAVSVFLSSFRFLLRFSSTLFNKISELYSLVESFSSFPGNQSAVRPERRITKISDSGYFGEFTGRRRPAGREGLHGYHGGFSAARTNSRVKGFGLPHVDKTNLLFGKLFPDSGKGYLF